MRHKFGFLGGTLNTYKCKHCGALPNSTTEKARCLWRDSIAEAIRAIRLHTGKTRRDAYREIYDY